MNSIRNQALTVHCRSIVQRDAWLAFLADCIANAERSHTPEEVAAAAEHLAQHPRNRQSALDLSRSSGV